MTNVRTLRMNSEVLAVSISPDAKFIAISELDFSVGVKVGHSLYLHFFIFFCFNFYYQIVGILWY